VRSGSGTKRNGVHRTGSSPPRRRRNEIRSNRRPQRRRQPRPRHCQRRRRHRRRPTRHRQRHLRDPHHLSRQRSDLRTDGRPQRRRQARPRQRRDGRIRAVGPVTPGGRGALQRSGRSGSLDPRSTDGPIDRVDDGCERRFGRFTAQTVHAHELGSQDCRSRVLATRNHIAHATPANPSSTNPMCHGFDPPVPPEGRLPA